MVDSATAADQPKSDVGSYVAILRWPEETAVLDQLRAAGTPRLLVVAPDAAAPLTLECDEDWIRLPASDDDMRVRISAVAARSARHVSAPVIKGDGRITFRGRWVALGGTEEAVIRTLAAHFGEVVHGHILSACVDPPLSGNAVRIQIMRLRSRLAPLGLELRTVRGHGYVLEATRLS
jgi:DNA-binding response OmpR family regulator